MSRRLAAVALIALLPFTLAAADPHDDAVACLGTQGGGHPPDLIRAVGWIGEEGSTAVWQLTFSRPLQVPDPVDPPFRVDVLVRDPHVPSVSFGNYQRVNRIVRFDASGMNAPVDLLFVPEGGHTPFNAPVIQGSTLTIEVPGRLLLGTDLFGRVDLERLRWSVLVRDGGRCDLLGNGSTALRLARTSPVSPSGIATSTSATAIRSEGGGSSWAIVAAAIAVCASIAAAAVVLRRRR